MSIVKTRCKFIVYLTLMIAALGFGGSYAIRLWMPEYYPPFYPSIPVFFYIYGLLFIQLYKLFPDKWLMLHILGKSAKLILGIIFVIAYIHFVGTHIKAFIMIFLCYYMIYLIFESSFFLNHELEMKKKNKK